MSKISDKSDKFLLHRSNFFRGPVFIGTQCIVVCFVLVVVFLCHCTMWALGSTVVTSPASEATGLGFDPGGGK